MYKSLLFIAVFSLSFKSVGKEAFMAGEAKNMLQSCTFLEGGGGGGGVSRRVRDMASPWWPHPKRS